MEQLFKGPIEMLLEKADIIYYADAQTTYLGFIRPKSSIGLNPAAAKAGACWAICKIYADGTSFPYEQQILWAGGSHNYDLIWNDRATFTYTFRNWT